MIDSRDAGRILGSLAKILQVDALGAHSYDGAELLCCGWCRGYREIAVLMRAEKLWTNGVHSSEWYEMEFPAEFREIINNSSMRFKPYQFLSLEDIAYHLKMHLADVEAAVARTLLKQALREGIYVEKLDGKEGIIFKARSLEEILVLADLQDVNNSCYGYGKGT